MQVTNSSQNTYLGFLKSTSTKNDDFFNFLQSNDYNKVLEKTLNKLNENEQKIHLQTLEELEKQGLNKEQLLLLNIFTFAKENIDLNKLSDGDKLLIEKYENLFKELYQAFKDNLETRLKFKKTQFELLHIDILLENKKSLDTKEGIL